MPVIEAEFVDEMTRGPPTLRVAPEPPGRARNTNRQLQPEAVDEPDATRQRLNGRFAGNFGGNGPRSTISSTPEPLTDPLATDLAAMTSAAQHPAPLAHQRPARANSCDQDPNFDPITEDSASEANSPTRAAVTAVVPVLPDVQGAAAATVSAISTPTPAMASRSAATPSSAQTCPGSSAGGSEREHGQQVQQSLNSAQTLISAAIAAIDTTCSIML